MTNTPLARGALVTAALACVSGAHAGLVNLAPGGATGLNGVTFASNPEIGGAIVGDLVIPFTIVGAGDELLYEAELKSRVVVSGVTSTLYFALSIEETTPGLNGIVSDVVYSGFEDWQTQVEWKDDAPGDVGPTRAERSIGGGNTIKYLFGDSFISPEESKPFFALTDATQYDLVGTAEVFLTTGESETLTVYAPVIPAPASAALLGAAGLGMIRRRR